MGSSLIITNGSSGKDAIRQVVGTTPTIISWDDVLHDGPVPYRDILADQTLDRIEYMSTWASEFGDLTSDAVAESFRIRDLMILRYSEFDEVVLWFDHDLYDQLQLMQVGWFLDTSFDSAAVPVSYVSFNDYLTPQNADRMVGAFAGRIPLAKHSLAVLAHTWRAYCSPHPGEFANLIDQRSHVFESLQVAILRMCQEYPHTGSRLTLTESQIVALLVENGALSPVELFAENRKLEDRPFLGDWSFWRYVRDLLTGDKPVLTITGADSVVFPVDPSDDAFKRQRVSLSIHGKEIARGTASWERPVTWKGGARLSDQNDWRWDESQRQLVLMSRRSS